MSVDLIRYDLLVQDALRAVVRRVLTDVAQDGLPGDHHLYVSFDTCAPGVRLSARLKEKYPEEMTIVLQHQFWDLIVTESFFEVGLSFNGIPERLHVPFSSLKGFFDPSVKFGLQFEPTPTEELEPDLSEPAPAATRPTSVPTTRGPVAVPRGETRPTRLEAVPKSAGKGSVESAGSAKVDGPAKGGNAAKPGASARPEPVAAATAPGSRRPGERDEDAAAGKAGNDRAAGNGKSVGDGKSVRDDKPAAQPKARDGGEKGSAADKAGSDAAEENGEGANPSGAQVVRLDAFRKK